MSFGMGLSRRQTMAWMLSAAAVAGARPAMAQVVSAASRAAAPWPVLKLAPLPGVGYGTDPDTMNPKAPWPLILAKAHRALINRIGDIVLPADALSKGAGALDIAAFFDEWISAPYPNQQEDRPKFLALLLWLDAQSRLTTGVEFVLAEPVAQSRMLDALLAYEGVPAEAGDIFAWFRVLMIMGYYSLPETLAVAGLAPEEPILGDYPGPTPEAMTHLNALLVSLDLPTHG
jgi:hypothetical protein